MVEKFMNNDHPPVMPPPEPPATRNTPLPTVPSLPPLQAERKDMLKNYPDKDQPPVMPPPATAATETVILESILADLRHRADHQRSAEEEESLMIAELEDLRKYDAIEGYRREQAFKARFRALYAEEHPHRSVARGEIELYNFLSSMDTGPCPWCLCPFQDETKCIVCGYSSEERTDTLLKKIMDGELA
jgi:hypothetical protein